MKLLSEKDEPFYFLDHNRTVQSSANFKHQVCFICGEHLKIFSKQTGNLLATYKAYKTQAEVYNILFPKWHIRYDC